MHRTKADESYQIGEPGHPVRAYLSVEAIIGAARAAGADAIYPGYGFLSENPDLAAACAQAGITFVGPSAQVLELTGNKARAIAAAKAAGLPVLASSEPVHRCRRVDGGGGVDDVPGVRQGGRRRRRPRYAPGRRDRPGCATPSRPQRGGGIGVRGCDGVPRAGRHRAATHRGADPRRHATATSSTCSNGTARCSADTRRSIELAPAPNLDPALRSNGSARMRWPSHARSATHAPGPSNSCSTSTATHVFIEMNPRIQVEHTVTEEITDVDLVQSQLRIAAGETLADIGLARTTSRSAVRPCSAGSPPRTPRTGSAPTPAASPPTAPPRERASGWTAAPRLGAEVGGALRFDAGEADLPRPRLRRRRSPGPDARWPSSGSVVWPPTSRSCRRFSTTPISGPVDVTTSFIEERPQLLTSRTSADRGTKILSYLADVTVNQPHGARPTAVYPHDKLPADRPDASRRPSGSRQRLLDSGPRGSPRRCAAQTRARRHRHHLP